MATAITEAVSAALAVDAAVSAKAVLNPWEQFDARARREEPRYRAAALRLFLLEREDVANRIATAPPSVKADTPNDPHPSIADPYIEAAVLRIAADYAPGGAYHEAWVERYKALIARTMLVGTHALPARTGLSFTLRNPRAQAAIQRRVTRLAGNVSETTLQRIRDIVTDARNQGQGVSVVAKRIHDEVFSGTISRARAVTIARTETVGALNEGAWVGATTAGVMQSKRWISQQDGRVRDSHVTADGDGWLPLTARFSNGLLYPHEAGAPAAEVVNCRCTLAYSDQAPNEAGP